MRADGSMWDWIEQVNTRVRPPLQTSCLCEGGLRNDAGAAAHRGPLRGFCDTGLQSADVGGPGSQGFTRWLQSIPGAEVRSVKLSDDGKQASELAQFS